MTRATAASLGFRTLADERTDEVLPVEGTIPSWLSGALIRNGPGRFDLGESDATHWFDGLAMLRRYAFEDGSVSYTNRFLRTEAYDRAERGDQVRQFATGGTGLAELRRWLSALGPPEPTDNANVHVARIGDAYVALTEVPRWIEFDPVTLETVGEFEFDDDLGEHMAAAHLRVDDHREETLGYGLSFGRQSSYHLYRIPHGQRRREQIASIDATGPGYLHSVAVTPNYVVVVEPPLWITPIRGLAPWNEGLLDMFRHKPEAGTRIVAVNRRTGDVAVDTTTAPFFVFHHVNAFEADGRIVMDLVAFEDPSIVESLSLDRLSAGAFEDVPDGYLTRYRVDPATGGIQSERQFAGGVELPSVPPEVRTRSYRYAYGQATDRTGENGLVKVDLEQGRAKEWSQRGVYVEEPRMVPRPGGDREDEGVVLATALDTDAERTYLLVFDAETLELRARARLPHAVPFGFHGRFFRSIPTDVPGERQ